MKLPYVLPPTTKIRTVGNASTGTLEIESIGSFRAIETEYFETNRVDSGIELAKQARAQMQRTGRKYPWADVYDSVRSAAVNTELKIDELQDAAIEFANWFDANTARNNMIAAVAIMRSRVVGCAEMTLAEFEDDAIVPPGLRSKLVEFAIVESNGNWDDTAQSKPGPEPKNAAPTEDEAAK